MNRHPRDQAKVSVHCRWLLIRGNLTLKCVGRALITWPYKAGGHSRRGSPKAGTTVDENQPREQAGFRSKYSTTDHIHAINQLKEKCREYNIPLCVAFVDYEKAFDSVQTQAILTSLQEQGIEDVYIEILKDTRTAQ